MSQDLEKVTVRLFHGHKDKLSEYFPDLGYNKVIRIAVHNLIKKTEEKLNETYQPQNKTIDIGDIHDGATRKSTEES